METNRKGREITTELPIVDDNKQLCNFNGYDADILMNDTAKLRKLVKERNI